MSSFIFILLIVSWSHYRPINLISLSLVFEEKICKYECITWEFLSTAGLKIFWKSLTKYHVNSDLPQRQELCLDRKKNLF